jgi:hypothetical protein
MYYCQTVDDNILTTGQTAQNEHQAVLTILLISTELQTTLKLLPTTLSIILSLRGTNCGIMKSEYGNCTTATTSHTYTNLMMA